MVASIFAAASEALGALGARRRDVAAAGLASQRSSCVVLGPARRPAAVAALQLAGPARARLAAPVRAATARTSIAARGCSSRRITARASCAGRSITCRRCARRARPARSAGGRRRASSSFACSTSARCSPIRSARRARSCGTSPRATGTRSCSRCSGLPRVSCRAACRPASAYGTLRIGDAAMPLTAVNGDQSAAVFAFGWPEEDSAYVNIGTSAFVQRALARAPRLRAAPAHRHHPRRRHDHGLHGRGQRQRRGHRARVAAHASSGIEDARGAAARSGSTQQREPPLFLNGIAGLGGPFWQPDFASRFVGEGEPWQKAVAVVESMAFLLQANIDEMAKYVPPARAHPRQRRRVAPRRPVPQARGAERAARCTGARTRKRPRAASAISPQGAPQEWNAAPARRSSRPSRRAALRARYRRWRALMAEATGI